MSLAGKIAIVTGGTRGIGLEVSKKLVSLGATVVVNYHKNEQAANEAVKALGGADKVQAVKADVGDIESLKHLVDTVVKSHKKIDILVNNAGIMIHENPSEINAESYERIFASNVKGPLFLTKLAAPHIPDGGRIIFLSSTLTLTTTILPHYCLYVATKGAIEQFARTSAKEFGARNVTVNTVSPGPTATELFLESDTEQVIKGASAAAPAKRLGKPEEIGSVIGFLVGPEATWVNGQNVRVNGGMSV